MLFINKINIIFLLFFMFQIIFSVFSPNIGLLLINIFLLLNSLIFLLNLFIQEFSHFLLLFQKLLPLSSVLFLSLKLHHFLMVEHLLIFLINYFLLILHHGVSKLAHDSLDFIFSILLLLLSLFLHFLRQSDCLLL